MKNKKTILLILTFGFLANFISLKPADASRREQKVVHAFDVPVEAPFEENIPRIPGEDWTRLCENFHRVIDPHTNLCQAYLLLERQIIHLRENFPELLKTNEEIIELAINSCCRILDKSRSIRLTRLILIRAIKILAKADRLTHTIVNPVFDRYLEFVSRLDYDFANRFLDESFSTWKKFYNQPDKLSNEDSVDLLDQRCSIHTIVNMFVRTRLMIAEQASIEATKNFQQMEEREEWTNNNLIKEFMKAFITVENLSSDKRFFCFYIFKTRCLYEQNERMSEIRESLKVMKQHMEDKQSMRLFTQEGLLPAKQTPSESTSVFSALFDVPILDLGQPALPGPLQLSTDEQNHQRALHAAGGSEILAGIFLSPFIPTAAPISAAAAPTLPTQQDSIDEVD